jgi:hypothetical protein
MKKHMNMEPMEQHSTEQRMAGEHAAEYEMNAAPERNDNERIEQMEEGIEPNEAQAATRKASTISKATNPPCGRANRYNRYTSRRASKRACFVLKQLTKHNIRHYDPAQQRSNLYTTYSRHCEEARRGNLTACGLLPPLYIMLAGY